MSFAINNKVVAAIALAVMLIVAAFGFSLITNAEVSGPIFLTRNTPVIATYPSSNRFSVGTTSASIAAAKLTVHANSGETLTSLFRVSSSTASANSVFVNVTNIGNVGIGTTTPAKLVDIFSTGTSTLSIDTNSATKGGCIAVKSPKNTTYYFFVDPQTGNWATTTAANC